MGNKLKAILVDIIPLEISKEEAYKRLEELECLVNTYGGMGVVKIIQKKGTPDYDTFIGKGKVEEILEIIQENKADLVVTNNILKPKQIFNLEEAFKKIGTKVWDRVDLILKIFSRHAQSTEAKLQIELAGIKHMGPRIYNMGIELSQQSGAVGIRSGQGETNIEIMKRHLRKQEQNILKKLEHYNVIRTGHRERRKKQNFKTVAIVGYTNVGKSSLLNSLTKKGAYVADKLFATLDTRIGKLYIQNKSINNEYAGGKEILVADTIGFIQDLPPSLIQAFKSTLSETVESDLILHVIDVADLNVHKKISVVEEILDQLGLHDKPKIYVFNKIDLVNYENFNEEKVNTSHPGLLKAGESAAKVLGWIEKEFAEKRIELQNMDPTQLAEAYRKFSPVFVSADKKLNLDGLIKLISENI